MLLGAVGSVLELQPRLSLALMQGFAAEWAEGQLGVAWFSYTSEIHFNTLAFSS